MVLCFGFFTTSVSCGKMWKNENQGCLNHCKENQLQVMTFNTITFFSGYVFINTLWSTGKKILSTLSVARLSSMFLKITHKGRIRSLLANPLHKASPSLKEKQQYQGAMRGQNTKPCVIFVFMFMANYSVSLQTFLLVCRGLFFLELLRKTWRSFLWQNFIFVTFLLNSP